MIERDRDQQMVFLVNSRNVLPDMRTVVGLTVGILCLRYILCGFGSKNGKLEKSLFGRLIKNKVRKRQEYKCVENLWYAVWHCTSLVLGIVTLVVEADGGFGWFAYHLRDPSGKWYWIATEKESKYMETLYYPKLPMSLWTKGYYLVELGFWVCCLICVTIETRRSDFLAMVFHHIFSIALISVSYTLCYWRIGIIVLILHDIVDVFLYTTKLLQCFIKGTAINVCFLLFVFSFTLCRMIIFPFYCIWPASNISCLSHLGFLTYWDVPFSGIIVFSLSGLVAINSFWFLMILKLIYVTFIRNKKDLKDIRSDDEFSDDDRDASNNQKTRHNKRD